MRIHVALMLGLMACGPLKNPFDALAAGACAQDADCVVATCPNACNQGAPYCSYPGVHAKVDVVKACPCFETPGKSGCAAPAGEACGPLPGCAGPFDVDQLRARCVSGSCAARMADGGTPP